MILWQNWDMGHMWSNWGKDDSEHLEPCFNFNRIDFQIEMRIK